MDWITIKQLENLLKGPNLDETTRETLKSGINVIRFSTNVAASFAS